MTIKSTRTISGKKKVVETIKKKCIKRDKFGEREREREREREYWPFCSEQLGRNRRERGGNEVKEFFNKIKLEE